MLIISVEVESAKAASPVRETKQSEKMNSYYLILLEINGDNNKHPKLCTFFIYGDIYQSVSDAPFHLIMNFSEGLTISLAKLILLQVRFGFHVFGVHLTLNGENHHNKMINV